MFVKDTSDTQLVFIDNYTLKKYSFFIDINVFFSMHKVEKQSSD